MIKKSNQSFPFSMNQKEDAGLEIRKMQGFGNIANEMQTELQMMDLLRVTSDHYVPDTFACNHYFLRFFPTSEMLMDFPTIAKYILMNDYERIYTADIEEYLEDCDIIDDPSALKINWFLNMLMTQAEKGNQYAVDIFKNLYETYYRKEYRQLRRFRKISAGEIISFSDHPDNLFIARETISRILTMSRFYEIEQDGMARGLYRFFDMMYQESHSLNEDNCFEGFPEEILKKGQEFETEYLEPIWEMTEREERKVLKAGREAENFTDAALKWLGLPSNLIDAWEYEFDSEDDSMVRALEIMLYYHTQKGYDFADIQRNAMILRILSAFENYKTISEEHIQRLIGYAPEKYEFENDRCMFDIEKLEKLHSQTSAAKSVKTKESSAQRVERVSAESTVSTEDYLSEIEALRHELRKKEKEIAYLKQRSAKLEAENREEKIRLQSYESDHNELLHLRDHLKQMTEQEEVSEEISIEEMEEYLQKKKIVIIGGHDNWTYKLKNKFRKWVFLTAEVNVANDGRVLDDADYIYFFTDILSHGTYGKFIRSVRDKKLRYGYIHTIHVIANIRQVYYDVNEAEKEEICL